MMHKPRIELHLRHELLPLPLIIQEVTILELDALDLRDVIIQEMTSNPLFDIDKFGDLDIIARKFEDLSESLESSSEPYFRMEEDEEKDRQEDFITYVQSPWEKLEAQIEAQFEKDREKKIAYAILEHLDNFGYLDGKPEEIATEIGVDFYEFENIRRVFVQFEPFGSGSSDFNEFLVLQLEDMGYHVPFAEAVDFVKQNEKIARRLIPYPFFQAEDEHIRYIVPELLIKMDENGELILLFNENIYPSFRVSKEYLALIGERSVDKDTIKYLEDKYKRVQKLVENFKKRKDYLLKAGQMIIDYQADYLKSKTSKLVPISQTEASKKLGIPVSTFNRILKSKYVDTPRGIYSLKFFFQKPFGKGSQTGNKVSKEDIQEKIRSIIEKEDKKRPLSDEEIASILNSYGIKISRRTVTKFRHLLGIPDSRDRAGE
ncbi:MAG: hypothetical protein ABIL92_01405 [candidate division WOR-3 bacterium]